MTKLDVSFFSHLQAYLQWKGVYGFGDLLQGLHFFLLESCKHQWKPILWEEEEEEEEDTKIIFWFWCMSHPILQFENILHFVLFGDHVDVNGNHYYEKKKKKTLKSYFWCMLHPILQLKNILHFFSLEIM